MDVGEYIIRVTLKASSDLSKALRGAADEIKTLTKAEEGHATAAKRSDEAERGLKRAVDDSTTAHESHTEAVKRSGVATATQGSLFDSLVGKAARAGEQMNLFARDIGGHTESVRRGVAETSRFAAVTSFLAAQVEKARGSFNGIRGPIDRWKTSMSEAAGKASSLGEGIIEEVGFALFIKYAQAAVTAVVSLGASLVSLISVVGQAAAGFGAGFVTALAQAVPVMAVVSAAMERFKLIMEAVQATEARSEESVAQRLQAHLAIVNATNSEANAQFALGQASKQSELATRALSEARRTAKREIEDLTAAEKEAVTNARSAEEAARRAELALARKRATGTASATELAEGETEVASAQERAAGAHRQVGRAQEDASRARSRGVNGSTAVISAAQAEAAAVHGVTQAKQQLYQAEQQLVIARATADRNLAKQDELLAKMTGTEREAYKAMLILSEGIQKVMRPIADIVVKGFVNMFGKLDELLKNNQVIGGLTKIAEAVAKSLDRIFGALTSGEGLKLFIHLLDDAASTVERLGGMLSKLIPAVLGIAHAATPFFDAFLGKLEKTLERFDKWVSSAKGNEALTKFFTEAAKSAEVLLRFLGAVFGWFASMPSAAEAGRKMIGEWTAELNKLSEWNKHHGAELAKVFENAREAVQEMLSVLGALIKEMAKSTDFGMIKTLTGLLKEAVIPALGETIRVFGKLSWIIHAFIDLPLVRELARWTLTFGFLTFGFGKIYEAVAKLKKLLIVLFGLLKEANPFAWVSVAIIVIGSLYHHVKLVREVVDDVKKAFEAVGDVISKGFGHLGPLEKAATVIAGIAASVAIIKSGLGQKVIGSFKDFSSRLFGHFKERGTPENPMWVRVLGSLPGGGPSGGARSKADEDAKRRAKERLRAAEGAGAASLASKARALAKKIPGIGKLIPGLGAAAGERTALGIASRAAGEIALVPLVAEGVNALLPSKRKVMGLPAGQRSLNSQFQSFAGESGSALTNVLGAGASLFTGDFGGALKSLGGAGKDIADALGFGNTAEDKVQKFADKVGELQKHLAHMSSGEITKIHNEAEKMANDPQFAKWLEPLHKIAEYFTPGSQQLAQGLTTLRIGLEHTSRAAGKNLGEISSAAEDTASYFVNALPKGSEVARIALATNFEQAAADVRASMEKGTVATDQGLKKIHDYMVKAFQALGIDPKAAQEMTHAGFNVGEVSTKLRKQEINKHGESYLTQAGFASGGYIKAQPGGQQVTVGEGNYDEVILSTDPRRAKSQKNLLQRFLGTAQHLMPRYADGGYVFPFPKGEQFGWDRIDQGQDLQGPPGGPVLAIGPGMVSIGHDAFSGFGPFYPVETLASGPWAGRPIYYGHTKDTRTGLVKAGDVIGVTQSRADQWTAAPAGWLELGFTSALGHGIQGQGAAVAPLLHALAAGRRVAAGVVGAAGEAFQQIQPPRWTGPGGLLGLLGRASLFKTTAITNAVIEQVLAGSEPSTGAPGHIVAGIIRIAQAAAKSAGVPWAGNIVRELLSKESAGGENLPPHSFGGNLDPAGPFQVISETFRAYAAPGHGNRMNPLDNALAAFRYIKAAYGTLANLAAKTGLFGPGYKGYEEGGAVRAAPGGHLAVVGEGGYDEVILTSDPAKAGRQRSLLRRFLSQAPHLARPAADGHHHHGHRQPPFQPIPSPDFFDPLQNPWKGNVRVGGAIDRALKLLDETFGQGIVTLVKAVSGVHIKRHETGPQITAQFTQAQAMFEQFETQMQSITAGLTTWGNKMRVAFVNGRAKLVKSGVTAVGRAEVTLRETEIEYKDWVGAEKGILHSIQEVHRVIKHGNSKQKAAAKAELGKLREQLEKAQGEVSEHLVNMQAQQAEVTQAQIGAVEKRGSFQASKLSVGTAALNVIKGVLGGGLDSFQSQLDKQITENLEGQKRELKELLPKIEAEGNHELAREVEEKINSLTVEVEQTIIKRITDAVASTEQRAGAELATPQAEAGLAQVEERRGKFSEARRLTVASYTSQNAILGRQRGELESERTAAGEAGDTQLVQELNGKIATLTTTIAQNNLTIEEASTKQILAMEELERSITQAAQSSESNAQAYAKLEEETFHRNTVPERIKTEEERRTTLRKERGAEEGALSETAGQLTGPAAQALEHLATLSGPALFRAANEILNSSWFQELPPAQQEAIEKEITALESTEKAILENTKEIMYLNGQLSQIQTLTTAAWDKFRLAILNGMGQFTTAVAAAVMPVVMAAPTQPVGATFATTGGASTSTPSHAATQPGDVHLHVTNPTEVADPIVLGRSFAFAMKTPAQ